MNPWVMLSILVVMLALFAVSAVRRWRLMMVGRPASRGDRLGERLIGVIRFGFGQQRLPRYGLAGVAHMFIFFGFLVLLLRSLVLFGRGFTADFDLLLLAHGSVIGNVYSFCKDLVIVLVVIGVVVFFYYRLVARSQRMTRSVEALLILGIIGVMMAADVIYDGSWLVLESRQAEAEIELAFMAGSPVGSLAALGLQNVADGPLRFLLHLGFWTHTSLVLIFLNILPYSKHFHVITALPNVFLRDLGPPGRLPKMEDIEGMLEREETLGVSRIENLSWKSILDLYTCTECGRCTDQCPANRTGKRLSPKQLAVDLRDYLYRHEKQLVGAQGAESAGDQVAGAEARGANGDGLVPAPVRPEVLWACTTCRACEVECPVFITYVDKIVDLRRHLVMEKGEFPSELQNAFQGLERDGNPWSFQAGDRGAWAEGLEVPLMAELGEERPEYLMWVGCAPSFDERAKKVSRATARLLQAAGVKFAILGAEETCNGDPARRAGNEFLFQMMAQANIEVLNNYGVKKIITTCPHCYNTLKNEYPDFGGHYQVIHHTELLAELVGQGRLKPRNRVEARVVFHDSCYLGRYNDVYDPPREVLRGIPGVELLEAAESRDRGMCCGAGGAQMFKEEEEGDGRVNHARLDQLLRTGPEVVGTSCPFCQVMLSDGLVDKEREEIKQFDVAELLWQSVAGEEQLTEAKASAQAEATG